MSHSELLLLHVLAGAHVNLTPAVVYHMESTVFMGARNKIKSQIPQ